MLLTINIISDILTHVASTMTLEQLIQVFPQRFSTLTNESLNNKEESSDSTKNSDYLEKDLELLNEIQNYEPFVTICKETMHANQIKELISVTARKLLITLDL